MACHGAGEVGAAVWQPLGISQGMSLPPAHAPMIARSTTTTGKGRRKQVGLPLTAVGEVQKNGNRETLRRLMDAPFFRLWKSESATTTTQQLFVAEPPPTSVVCV
jgi:hypothetical protein